MSQKTTDKDILELRKIVQKFSDEQPDIKGQIVMAYPSGVPIANSWEGEVDPILVGAISAAVKLTFRYLCEHLGKGELKRLFINSKEGKILIQNAGEKAILTTIMTNDADIYRIAFLAGDLASKIEELTKNYEY
ncbi:MAG: roadblock/LC7 domain-containing protein [Promethearchaeota archaeon]